MRISVEQILKLSLVCVVSSLLFRSAQALAPALQGGPGTVAAAVDSDCLPLRVAVLGDSNTEKPWFGQSWIDFVPLWIPEKTILFQNFAVGGAKVAVDPLVGPGATRGNTGLQQLAEVKTSGFQPNVFIVALGTNNITKFQSASAVFREIEILVEAIEADFPQAQVIVATVPPIIAPAPFFSLHNQQVQDLNSLIQQRYGPCTIDFYSVFYTSIFPFDLTYFFDGIHHTQIGQLIKSVEVVPAIQLLCP